MEDDAERERRRDELAWATVNRGVEAACWRIIDRAVAKILPLARERGLLSSPWRVPVIAAPSACFITVEPSGEWELATADSGTGAEVYATSSRPGVCPASVATARWVSRAFSAALKL